MKKILHDLSIYTRGKKDTAICLCMIWNKGTLSKHKSVKSHTTALGFRLQTDMNQIFQMRHCTALYILVSQEVAKIFEVKVGGRKENCQLGQPRTRYARGWLNRQIFYRPPTLTFDIFAASWPTRMHSTSFERSDSYLFGAWSPMLWYDF